MSELELGIVENLVMLVIQLLVPALLGLALGEFRRWREQQAEDSAWWRVEEAVQDAVAAAEQLGLSGQLETYAGDKLAYATEQVEGRLAAMGLPLDLDPYGEVIRGMIEAEVRRQFG